MAALKSVLPSSFPGIPLAGVTLWPGLPQPPLNAGAEIVNIGRTLDM